MKWADSRNRWKRRAACATLSKLSRKGDFLNEVFATAKRLFSDDEMVQKEIGWMLKEASRARAETILNFIDKYHSEIPRHALRYAIERMDRKRRQEILDKY